MTNNENLNMIHSLILTTISHSKPISNELLFIIEMKADMNMNQVQVQNITLFH